MRKQHHRQLFGSSFPLLRALGAAILAFTFGCGSGAVFYEPHAATDTIVRSEPAAPEFKPDSPEVEKEHTLLIAGEGKSNYSIVVSGSASPATRHAATELQAFLREITGAELPIVSDHLPPEKYEIILGNNARLRELNLHIDFGKLGDEGYTLRTAGDRLIIAGGEQRGTIYGVYGLLEDHLGCRWFTSEVSRIPRQERLEIASLDETVIPALEYREAYISEAYDGDWAARNRLNRNSRDGGLAERHGGRIEFVPGYFAHTFDKLVPTAQYYRKHPEYYSLVNGRRLKTKNQLCCTNKDVIRIATESVLKIFRDNPRADILSVSQNDWYNGCQCKKCRALADAEGTDMAPVLFLVNKVAEAVEKEFPGKSIETLAYQWTRKAPKTMRPRSNVVIRLCTIECCFSHPLQSCTSPQNAAFARDLRDWAKVADRLWIWNYNTSFAHYFIPFPDLRTRGDNIRFFVENHVKGIFQQDIYSTSRGELSDLSAYLNAKLLWDPEYDENTAIDEFLAGVYGPADKYIREYIDLLHDTVERENIHIGIWQGPDAEYLTDEILARADSLWDAAENATADLPEVRERVRIARLSVDYAILCRDRLRGDALCVEQDGCCLAINPAFTERLNRFCAIAADAGVNRLKEYNTRVVEFRVDMEKSLRARSFKPVSPVSCAEHAPGLVYRYYEGSWSKLPDFARLIPNKSGAVEQLALPFPGNGKIFGFTITGYIEAPKDGLYTFWTRSDGYSGLSVAGTKIVDNSGMDPIRERSGHIALKAGLHPVTLTYYTKTACTRLAVSWRGPGFEKTEIPAESFQYERSANAGK
ncbi:MAG: DUF4838 domain-containing protein [Candidatus Latescibacterota bacterium]